MPKQRPGASDRRRYPVRRHFCRTFWRHRPRFAAMAGQTSAPVAAESYTFERALAIPPALYAIPITLGLRPAERRADQRCVTNRR